jgi:hypothetical protein
MPDFATMQQIVGGMGEGNAAAAPVSASAIPSPAPRVPDPAPVTDAPTHLTIHPMPDQGDASPAGQPAPSAADPWAEKMNILQQASKGEFKAPEMPQPAKESPEGDKVAPGGLSALVTGSPAESAPGNEGMGEDIKQTTLKTTVPMGVVGRVTYPADLFNLAFHYGGLPLMKHVATGIMGRPFTPEEEQRLDQFQPLYGTKDIVQGAEKAAGIQPHDPHTLAAKYLDTIGQVTAGGVWKPIGAKSGLSLKQAVAAGIGSETAGQVFEGTPLEPFARIAGGMVPGAARSAAERPIQAVKTMAGEAGIGKKEQIGNVSATKAQQQAAAESLHAASTNPTELQQNITQGITSEGQRPTEGFTGPMPGQENGGVLVEGSKPTLAEVVPDHGVAQWQDALQTQNRDVFNARKADQTAARVSSLEKMRGEGTPEAVGDLFRQHLDDLEAAGDASISKAETEADARLQQAQTAAEEGVQKAQGEAEAGVQGAQGAADAAAQEARGKVRAATEEIGGFEDPQAYGQKIRGSLEDAAVDSKKALGKLWDALKPYDKSKIAGGGIVKQVRAVRKEVNPKAGQVVTPQEDAIYSAVEGWKKDPTFGTLRDLNSQISEAQRALRMQFGNESRPMRRLGLLKESVRKAMQKTITDIAKQEQTPAAGKAAPTSPLDAKIAGLVDEWYGSQNGSEAKTAEAGRNPAPSPEAGAAENAAAVSGVAPAEGAPTGGSGTAAGSAGGEPAAAPAEPVKARRAPPKPPQDFTDSARKAWNAANKGTVEHKSTFRQGAVGQALKEGRAGTPYQVQDSNVASIFFNSKDNSPENIRALVKASGGRTEAIEALQDAAAADLRANALNADGTMNPTRFEAWTKRNQKAIEAFPELQRKLNNARAAQRMLTEAEETGAEGVKEAAQKGKESVKAAQATGKETVQDAQVSGRSAVKAAKDTHRTNLRDFQRSAAADFIHKDPASAVASAFGSGNSKQAFADLVDRVKGNADATEGLKAAVAEHIMKKARTESDTLGSDLKAPANFRNLVSDHREALKSIFGGQGVQNLEAISADIRRQQKVPERAKIAGQSNTTPDALNVAKQGKASLLGRIAKEAASHATSGGAVLGEVAGGHWLLGGTLGFATKTINAMRAAGVDNIEKLKVEMALNPELAREMLRRMDSGTVPIPVQKRIVSALSKHVPAIAPKAGASKLESDEE